MSNDLLPINATPQERAISEAAARIDSVPVRARQMWDPQTCPANLLPWLAWALSVDEWNAAWSDQQKRDTIAASFKIHSTKGTLGAVRAALQALGYNLQITEWWQDPITYAPYTFGVIIDTDGSPLTEDLLSDAATLIDETKNTRSHLGRLRVITKNQTEISTGAVTVYGGIFEVYDIGGGSYPNPGSDFVPAPTGTPQGLVFVTESSAAQVALLDGGLSLASDFVNGFWAKAKVAAPRRADADGWYFEILVGSNYNAGAAIAIGVATAGTNTLTDAGSPTSNAGDGGRLQYHGSGQKRSNGVYEPYGPAYGNGDTIGCGVRKVGNDTEIRFFKNGVDIGQAFIIGGASMQLEPHVCLYGTDTSRYTLKLDVLKFQPQAYSYKLWSVAPPVYTDPLWALVRQIYDFEQSPVVNLKTGNAVFMGGVVTVYDPKFGSLSAAPSNLTGMLTAGEPTIGAAEDFTFELFVKIPPTQTNTPSFFASGATSAWFGVEPATNRFYVTGALTILNGGFDYYNPVTIPEGWNHVALVRSGTQITVFLNGVSCGVKTAVPRALPDLKIMDANHNGVRFIGVFDAVRLTAAARYTADFTPPSDEYPTA